MRTAATAAHTALIYGPQCAALEEAEVLAVVLDLRFATKGNAGEVSGEGAVGGEGTLLGFIAGILVVCLIVK